MVKYSSDRLDLIFKALSDSTRRAMLYQLSKKELSVTELAKPFDMSLAAVSKHLKVLNQADFLEKTKDGRNYRCRANLSPLDGVTELLEELGAHWRRQLDSLDIFLTNEIKKKEKESGSKKNK